MNFIEFEQEVSIMSSFDHQNIVSFYSYSPSDCAILMEYMDQGDLRLEIDEKKQNKTKVWV